MAEAFYDNVPANIQLLESDVMKHLTNRFLAPVPVPEPYPVNLVLLTNIATMSDLEQIELSLFSGNTEIPPEAQLKPLVRWLEE
jgi:hypothetical protein